MDFFLQPGGWCFVMEIMRGLPKGVLLLSLVMALHFPAVICCAEGGAVLRDVRVGRHADFTRLVFDMDGPPPSRINSQPGKGILVEFQQMRSEVQPEAISSRLSPEIGTLAIDSAGGGQRINITFRDSGTTVKHYILNGGSTAGYRLVLDFSSAPNQASAPAIAIDAKVRPEPRTTIVRPEKGNPRKKEEKSRNQEPTPEVKTSPPAPPLQPAESPSGTNEKAEHLYAEADEFFLAHQDALQRDGHQAISNYEKALKAGPGSANAPLALYRCGLGYLAVGDHKKAEEFFRNVISRVHVPSLVGECWLRLGQVHERNKSYMEAVQACRAALNFPLEKAMALEAHYTLARVLPCIDGYKEAVDAAKKCLEDDPTFHLKRPDILRIIGEAYFAIQQYDKSSDYLLRYVNIAADVQDRDVVLAKIAEALLYRNEQDLANKVYGYIEKNYPESEGYIISRIRKAEFLERQGSKKENAHIIYEDLARKQLSPTLSSLVAFKLASWEREHGNYEKSLSLIDPALHNKSDPASIEEFSKLREKVVCDYLKSAFSEKNHPLVINLYKENQRIFDGEKSPEYAVMAAESLAALNMHPAAVEIYRKLLNASGNNNEDWLLKVAQYSYFSGDMDATIQACQAIKSPALEPAKAGILGRIYFSQEKYREACQQFAKHFQKEQDIDKSDIQVLLSYSQSLMQEGRNAEALSWLQKASRFNGYEDTENRTQVGLLLGKCLHNLKQPEKAIEALEEVLSIVEAENLKDRINYELSLLYVSVGKQDKATERLSQLMNSSQSLWKAAAQQELGYLELHGSGAVNVPN